MALSRISVRAKIALLTIAVTGTIVLAMFAVQLNNVIESWLANTRQTAELTGNHVRHLLTLRLLQWHSSDPTANLNEILGSDTQFQQLLESTMAQARSVMEVSIAGPGGTIIASSTPFRKGMTMTSLPDLQEFQTANPFVRILRVLNQPGRYQVTLPLGSPGQPKPVYTIQVVLSSALLRDSVMPALERVSRWGAAGMLCAVFLAWASSRLLAEHLNRISTAIDRISRGEDASRTGVPPSAELNAIEWKLNVLGHQFRGAEQIRSAVDRVLDNMREAVLVIAEDERVLLAGGGAYEMLGATGSEGSAHLLEDVLPPETPSAVNLIESYRAGIPLNEHKLEINDRRLIVSLDFVGNTAGRQGRSALLRIRDAAADRELHSHVGVLAQLDGISRITSSVAHEIKNPLNSIAVRLDNLHAWAADEFPEANEDIALIIREIDRLDRVVRTFLDFTKPVEIENDTVSVAALLSEIAEMVEPDALRCGVTLRYSGGTPEIFILGDSDLLREAILNIVRNGIEAMPSGGVLTMGATEDGGQAHIEIADTGPGIPESLKDKIFDLYYTTKKDGTGLGLPRAFRTVQLHGGTMDIDSDSSGTRFHLYLPVANAKDTTTA